MGVTGVPSEIQTEYTSRAQVRKLTAASLSLSLTEMKNTGCAFI
jgi:hypothetical protein